ncbi:MAG: hypothetical protein ACE5HY_02635 [Candidatus Hydrothermarchaeales archaeon]
MLISELPVINVGAKVDREGVSVFATACTVIAMDYQNQCAPDWRSCAMERNGIPKNRIKVPLKIQETWPAEIVRLYESLAEALQQRDGIVSRKLRAVLRERGIRLSDYSKSKRRVLQPR